MNDPVLQFGPWLGVQLEKAGMSQRQLADRSGIDHGTISRIVKRDVKPKLETAHRLTKALGVSFVVGVQAFQVNRIR